MAVSRKTGELYYTDSEKDAALRNNNALEYALSRGYHLVKVGSHYSMKEHDSMIFKLDGKWYWISKGVNGRAIDFIQHYEGRSMTEAILTLAGTLNDLPPRVPITLPKAPEMREPFVLPERTPNYNSAFAYLQNTRKIDPDLVRRLVHEGKIQQVAAYTALKICGYASDGMALYRPREPEKDVFKDARHLFKDHFPTSLDGKHALADTPAAVTSIRADEAAKLVAQGEGKYGYRLQNLMMAGLDENERPRYASLRSMNTQGKSFKVDVDGSDKSYPFLIQGATDANTVCVFESPIEAMSYWSLCRSMGSGHLQADMLSLGGAGTHLSLDRYLREHPQVKHIMLGLNNDIPENGHNMAAGQNGTEKIMEAYGDQYDISIHTPHLNDWNDVLKNFRERNLEPLMKGIQQQTQQRPIPQQAVGMER